MVYSVPDLKTHIGLDEHHELAACGNCPRAADAWGTSTSYVLNIVGQEWLDGVGHTQRHMFVGFPTRERLFVVHH